MCVLRIPSEIPAGQAGREGRLLFPPPDATVLATLGTRQGAAPYMTVDVAGSTVRLQPSADG